MELALLGGIILTLFGIILVMTGVALIKDGDASGIGIFIFSAVIFTLGLIISIESITDTTIKDVKSQSLNYMVEKEQVVVKTNMLRELEYVLLDSTQVDLFNYLMIEIKEDYLKTIKE